MIRSEDIDFVLSQIKQEYYHAREKHRGMNSSHEGYAVIKEELEELWDEVKKDNHENARLEAYQIAAMALAYILEVTRK